MGWGGGAGSEEGGNGNARVRRRGCLTVGRAGGPCWAGRCMPGVPLDSPRRDSSRPHKGDAWRGRGRGRRGGPSSWAESWPWPSTTPPLGGGGGHLSSGWEGWGRGIEAPLHWAGEVSGDCARFVKFGVPQETFPSPNPPEIPAEVQPATRMYRTGSPYPPINTAGLPPT